MPSRVILVEIDDETTAWNMFNQLTDIASVQDHWLKVLMVDSDNTNTIKEIVD